MERETTQNAGTCVLRNSFQEIDFSFKILVVNNKIFKMIEIWVVLTNFL